MLQRTTILSLLCAAFACIWASPVLAQRKPDPARIEPPRLEEPNIELWAEAYEQFQAPEILVLCGWSSGVHQTSPGQTSLFNMDQTGVTVQLRNAFIEVINDPSVDAWIVDENTVRDAVRRLDTALLNNSAAAASRLLANEVQANLLITIELLDRKPSGFPNRVQFKAVDVTTGRTLTTFPFEWKLADDVASIKVYGRQIARKFIEDIAGRAINPPTYNLRIFGMGADARLPKLIKDAIEEIPGVTGRIRPRTSSGEVNPRTGVNQSLTRYAVKFLGDYTDLSYSVTESLGAIDDVYVVHLPSGGQEINLEVFHVVDAKDLPKEVEETFQGCLDLILFEGELGDLQRTRIFDLYEKQDSPSIAVLVNRQPTRREVEIANEKGLQLNANTVVMVNAAGDDVNAPVGPGGRAPIVTDEEELRRITQLERQTNLVETALLKRLGPELLNFNRKDASTARARMLQHMDKQRTVFGQDELVQILRQHNIADIVIFGSGGTLPDGRGGSSITYTFRAIQISDAGVIGVASVREALDGRSEAFIAQELANRAIEALVCEMKESWSPPNNLEVLLTNITDADDWDLFQQTILQRSESEEESAPLRLKGQSRFQGGAGQGTGELTLSYQCAFSDLINEINLLASELPYGLSIVSIDANRAEIAIVK